MWKFCVETAFNTILDFYSIRGGRTVPPEIQCAVFNIMAGHILDAVMANYFNESLPHELMDKLKECFNPKTTVLDANKIFQLFHLRCRIYKMDKLLDDATNLVSKLLAKGVNISDHIFYSAIVSIISPAYAHIWAAYKAGV
jgi:hypothetical protein